MGTAPLSKPLPNHKPIRPFAAVSRKTCVAQSLLPNSSNNHSSTLQQLILRQDWQRVLIRAKLFQHELSQPIRMLLYGLHIQVLPLHLVCTLQPPAAVVQLFLQLYVDAAGTPVTTTTKRKGGGKLKKRSRMREWRRNRKGAFPEDSEQLLSGNRQPLDEESQVSRIYSAPNFATREDEVASISSGYSSRPDLALLDSTATSWDKGVILQLSPSGGLCPLTVNQSHETQSTKSTDEEVYAVDWDLRPLWELVQTQGELLPLHLACLYQCSPMVVETLLKNYPFAALCEVVGMLPLHIVAAGWILKPIQTRPNLLPEPVMDPSNDPAPHEVLQVLLQIVPETRTAKSLNHSMTAMEYVEQCMEEGKHKESCLSVLQQIYRDDDDDEEEEDALAASGLSVSTPDSIIFVDSSDSSQVQSTSCMGLTVLLQNQEWETALQVLEDDPTTAQQWLYGVDEEESERLHVWKRLPLHLACAYGAPVGLVDVLLKTFPESADLPDDTLCLPLHIACRSRAPLPIIEKLLEASPAALCAVEKFGRLPLHLAIRHRAPYVVIEKLVDVEPEAIPIVDASGKTSIDTAVETLGEEHVVVELLSMVLVFMERQAGAREA